MCEVHEVDVSLAYERCEKEDILALSNAESDMLKSKLANVERTMQQAAIDLAGEKARAEDLQQQHATELRDAASLQQRYDSENGSNATVIQELESKTAAMSVESGRLAKQVLME